MMINKKVADLMVAQIGNELGASNEYLQIAVWFDGQAYHKLAAFFYKQSAEEHEHAMKFLHFLVETGADVKIPAVAAPSYEIKSAEHAFQMSLDWENKVTGQVHAMVAAAIETKDYASQNFLQWFVSEQVEEVSTMESMLQVVRRAGEKNLLMIEAYLTHGE